MAPSLTPVVAAPPTLPQAVAALARLRLRVARNAFTHGSLWIKLGIIALTLALAAGGLGLWWLIGVVLEILTSPELAAGLARAGLAVDVAPYLLALPALAFAGALALLFLGSFSSALAAFYLRADLDLLLAAPLSTRAVFIVTFFGNLVTSYLLLFVLVGPALVGYGQGMGFGLAFFLAAPLALALTPLLPAGLATLLVMAVVRVLPARRVQAVLGVLGALMGALWFIISQFMRDLAPYVANAGALEALRRLQELPLPSSWAGRALVAAGQGDWPALLTAGGGFALASIGVFAGCVLAAERLYTIGWAQAETTSRARRVAAAPAPAPPRARGLEARLRRALPAPIAAIIAKDLRVVPRDPRQLEALIFPLALSAIWMAQFIAGGRAPRDDDGGFGAALAFIGPAGISFFLCLAFSNALAGSGIGRERGSFWLIKVAPVSAWEIVLGKLALAYLPFPLIGAPLTLALAALQGSTLGEALGALLLLLIAGVGVSSIGIGLGAAFPRLDWENPRQQHSRRAGLFSVVLYPLYLALVVGATLGLPALAALAPGMRLGLAIAGWTLCLALTAAVAWAILAFGAARLERLEA